MDLLHLCRAHAPVASHGQDPAFLHDLIPGGNLVAGLVGHVGVVVPHLGDTGFAAPAGSHRRLGLLFSSRSAFSWALIRSLNGPPTMAPLAVSMTKYWLPRMST